jgi:hypothetical protein
VVVVVGVTVTQPLAPFTVPGPGAMVMVVALETFQQSDDWPPDEMTVGEAVKLITLGTAAPPTVTVTAALTEVAPSAPVTVSV